MRTPSSGSASFAKSNTLTKPISIDDDKEGYSIFTPLKVLYPESKEQYKTNSEDDDDDASSEGEDFFSLGDFGGFDAQTFEENMPSVPSSSPLAIILFMGHSF